MVGNLELHLGSSSKKLHDISKKNPRFFQMIGDRRNYVNNIILRFIPMKKFPKENAEKQLTSANTF